MAILRRQDEEPSGTLVVSEVTTGTFSVNTSIRGSTNPLSASNVGTAPFTANSQQPSNIGDNISKEQPIPLRTLIAVCVAAFVLLVGTLAFVLWCGTRRRKGAKSSKLDEDATAADVSRGTTGEEHNLKGFTSYNYGTRVPIPLGKSPSSANSHSYQSHGHRFPASTYNPLGHDEDPASGKTGNYSSAALYSQGQAIPLNSDFTPSPPSRQDTLVQSPQSTTPGAKAITHPYAVGSHPYSNSYSSPATPSHARPSFERTATSTVAIASPEPDHGVGLGPSSGSPGGFIGAGARPGYEAYGVEPRQTGTPGTPGGFGTGPVTLVARPSLESIRNIAKKGVKGNYEEQTSASVATDFVRGGPTAVGHSRSRNNSTSSSVFRHNHNRSLAGDSQHHLSQYAESVSPSTRTGKEAPKEKRSKQERARELAAMGNLIAALDESAEKERRRKEKLAAAAGFGDDSAPPSTFVRKEKENARRKELAVVGSYELPPADVFRAALGTSHGERERERHRDVGEPDDDEIERWRRG